MEGIITDPGWLHAICFHIFFPHLLTAEKDVIQLLANCCSYWLRVCKTLYPAVLSEEKDTGHILIDWICLSPWFCPQKKDIDHLLTNWFILMVLSTGKGHRSYPGQLGFILLVLSREKDTGQSWPTVSIRIVFTNNSSHIPSIQYEYSMYLDTQQKVRGTPVTSRWINNLPNDLALSIAVNYYRSREQHSPNWKS